MSGKSDVYVLVVAARNGFTMVSRRNIFVEGTCTPSSALLVSNIISGIINCIISSIATHNSQFLEC